MQKVLSIILTYFFILFFSFAVFSQEKNDSTIIPSGKKVIADQPSKFNPRTATIRSAILPGLGQVYNKKYWKVPIVYAALGITGGIFVYNVRTYKKLKNAYINKIDGDDTNNGDIDPKFRSLSAESLRSYRNTFRQNIDYSALFFILFWGLNVIDATVDAHLRGFDVNDDLSLKIKPAFQMQNPNVGVSFVFTFK